MKHQSGTRGSGSEKLIRTIKRKTRRQYGAEEKIRIVLDGLRGEDSIAELCRREVLSESMYYKWSKEFLEAGKKRLSGDTVREVEKLREISNRERCRNESLRGSIAADHSREGAPSLLY